MARLVIVTHEYDRFAPRERWRPWRHDSGYLLFDVLRELAAMGHSWRIAPGPRHVPGDAALLHVDATIVDPDYLALAPRYERTINFATADISKARISGERILRGADWGGPVIAKANLNARGLMEAAHNRRAARAGRPPAHPGVAVAGTYRILPGIDAVDDAIWDDPAMIVERFLPERHEEGWVIRTWVFMGTRERCTWQVASDPIVKAGRVLRYEPAEVPDALRAERARLGFEFGKFDFVIHDGRPILLDTNRTPGVATAIRPLMKAGARNLADGLDGLLRG